MHPGWLEPSAARIERDEGTKVEELWRLLVCPGCHGSLGWSADQARCGTCGRAYPIIDGIPVLALDQRAAHHDELDQGYAHKARQAVFFDHHATAAFEITRPHGTPGFYRWLLSEKFRRSVNGLRTLLPGTRVLTVCGGSGMDAEFLARMGARVITSDLSLEAARRARARARRYGFALTSIVADVEQLPFLDRAVDVVYVHDGLHHLEEPTLGLAEMARVAARAVSVTEPARALATTLAVRLGLALEREEAGNRVARLTRNEVGGIVESRGFRVVYAERYAMYYRHQPGLVCQILSAPGLLWLTRLALRVVNWLAGRFGNKLTVQAVRDSVLA